MADPEGSRRLTAILAADAAGYSRLMQIDDRGTVATLDAYRGVFREHIEAHEGRIVDMAGDSILAVFDSPTEAVRAAFDIQSVLAERNEVLPEERRMRFRIGVNLGEVISKADGTVYGDGVNIAARLQSIAEAGGVTVSGTVFDQVKNRLHLGFDFIGEQEVKNIAELVRVYRLSGEGRQAASTARRRAPPSRRAVIVLVAAIAVLAATVAGGWYATRSRLIADPVLALPTGPSVAVLPFANLSGDPKQDYFADGITEQIITELARFRNLFVLARNSTFQYKGKAVDVRQVGKELGARYVVEGSVQRGGDMIRVTVQLLDAKTGVHLWAETYERNLKQVKAFGIQDDVTERVVTAIGDSYGVISRATFEESKDKGTDSLDAYECVLRHYAYMRVMNPNEHASARDCLERAVKLAPTYAEAWAALGDIYADEHSQAFNPRPDSLGRALHAAQRAVELDPTSQRAYTVLGKVHFFLHDMDAFVPAAERAVALNPNNADVLAWYGLFWTYGHMGDPVKRVRGIEAMKKAIALSPMYPTWYHFPIAWHHYWNGDYATALAQAKKIDMPGYFWTHALLATIYGAMDRKADARAAVSRLMELYPEFPRILRQESRKWNTPEFIIDRYVHDLRRAGLDIPEEG